MLCFGVKVLPTGTEAFLPEVDVDTNSNEESPYEPIMKQTTENMSVSSRMTDGVRYGTVLYRTADTTLELATVPPTRLEALRRVPWTSERLLSSTSTFRLLRGSAISQLTAKVWASRPLSEALFVIRQGTNRDSMQKPTICAK